MTWLNINFFDIMKSWWRGDAPVGGVLMAMTMAVLRMYYSGASGGKIILEGLLCGALTLSSVSAMSFFNVPQHMTIAIGGFIGFVSVKKISEQLSRYISNKNTK